MRIVFLCGSLEPGRDGVGDYTRRLAGAVIKLHHEATIVAFNDASVQIVTKQVQNGENEAINVLRIPTTTAEKVKVEILSTWIKDINPEWISIQYVPFAYQLKGLPIRFASQLKAIGSGCKWQIMFHELWVGMKTGSSLKAKLIGSLQRFIIRLTIKRLDPQVVHTQCHLYLEQLKKYNIEAIYLPLFGNIPVVPVQREVDLDTSAKFILFGGIHPDAKIEVLGEKLAKFQKNNNKPVEFYFIGRNGALLTSWVETLKKLGITTIILGEKSVEDISAWLQKVKVGVFTTPAVLAEKSGSVAAMLEHGLSVLCVQQDWEARGLRMFAPPLPFLEIDKVDIEKLLSGKTPQPYNVNLNTVAKQFIKSLLS